MRKNILMLLLLATFTYAADKKDFYVGAGLGSGGGEYTVDLSSATASSSEVYATDYSLLDIKFGIIYKNNNRLEFSYTSTDVAVSGLKDKSLTGFDIDYAITADLNNNEGKFLPFISFGIGSYTWNDTGALMVSGEDITGLSLNLGIGAYFSVASDIEIEAAYKLKTVTWQDILVSTTVYSPKDSMSLFYIGAKYKF